MKKSVWSRRLRGFTLLELVVVMAIVIAIAAMAVPRLTTAIAQIRLRSSASALTNLMQRARMSAVQGNRTLGLTLGAVGGAPAICIDTDNNNACGAAEPAYVLPTNVSLNPAAVPASAATLGFAPQSTATIPRFNGRGLPCVPIGALCSSRDAGGNAVGFAYYLQNQPALGAAGLVAISVNPTGRTAVLSWDGRAWH
jgi:Tfp pilus assembly protein FimT